MIFIFPHDVCGYIVKNLYYFIFLELASSSFGTNILKYIWFILLLSLYLSINIFQLDVLGVTLKFDYKYTQPVKQNNLH